MDPSVPRRRLAFLGALVLGVWLVATPGTAVAAGCAVTYVVGANWGSGFQSQLTLTPGPAVTSWAAEFDVADGGSAGGVLTAATQLDDD